MATEKQIAYINSLIADNRNVPYLAGSASETSKKDWIVKSLGMPVYWPNDDDSFTAEHYSLDELMQMRNAKIDELAASDDASKAIDALKRMLGRR